VATINQPINQKSVTIVEN